MSKRINENTVGGVKKEQVRVQYVRMGNMFHPAPQVPETVDVLPAGVYKTGVNMEGSPYLEVHEAKTDELLRFDDPRQDEVINEVQKFWSKEASFKEMGFTHKRGMLLTGDPGTGKSCILKLVMEEVVKQGDLVLVTRSPYALCKVIEGIKEIEDGRRILAIMEDADELCQYSEHEMLQLFDGDNQFDNLLILGTTNYPERFNPRMLRPGRFDRKLKIGVLPEAGRKAYFDKKLGGNPTTASLVDSYVKLTDGFSFAQMREFLVSTHCLDHDPATAAQRIRSGSIEEGLNDEYTEEELDAALLQSSSKRFMKVIRESGVLSSYVDDMLETSSLVELPTVTFTAGSVLSSLKSRKD